MEWIKSQASDLFAYGWAVGVYWIALMGILFLIAGDGADWAAPRLKAKLNTVIPASPRRNLEIALMLLAVFLAGFETWHDQYSQAAHLERQRQDAVRSLATWKSRADERWHAIHDSGGYLDRIAKLEGRPPKTIIQRVPGPAVVIPQSGEAMTPDQIEKTKQLRVGLAEFLNAGLALEIIVKDKSVSPPVDAAQKWADQVEGFLLKNLDESYVIRFRDGSNIPSLVLNNSDNAHQNLWWGIHVRLVRLNQFVTEFSR